jgi:hypothetical protein
VTRLIVRDHDQISVRVLHKDFALSRLPITDLAPDITRAGMERPASDFKRPLYRLNARDVDLEHDAAPEGRIKRRCLPIAGALAQHELRAPFEIDEQLLRPLIRDRETMKRKRSNRDSASRAEPEVRIHLPPARSLLRTSLSERIPSENRRSESIPLEATAPENAAVAPG